MKLIKICNRSKTNYECNEEKILKAIKVLEDNGFEVEVADPYTALYETELINNLKENLVLSKDEMENLTVKQKEKLISLVNTVYYNNQDKYIDFEYADNAIRKTYEYLINL